MFKMTEFLMGIIVGLFVSSIKWRIKKFKFLPKLENIYLKWERHTITFILKIAPVAIPGLMLLGWVFVVIYYVIKHNLIALILFYGATAIVWYIGPLFELNRPMYNLINKWYLKFATLKDSTDKD